MRPALRDVEVVSLEHGGITASISPFGATLMSLVTPDRDGRLADIVLGYDDAHGYRGRIGQLGATVGRYANRIADARFALDGRTSTVEG